VYVEVASPTGEIPGQVSRRDRRPQEALVEFVDGSVQQWVRVCDADVGILLWACDGRVVSPSDCPSEKCSGVFAEVKGSVHARDGLPKAPIEADRDRAGHAG
jgi:hypothetical protein